MASHGETRNRASSRAAAIINPKNKSHGETQIYERMVPCENGTAI